MTGSQPPATDSASAPSVQRSPLTVVEWICALLLTVFILGLAGFRQAVRGEVWRDETACIQLALMPTIADIWNNFEHEAFPPVFHFLLRAYLLTFGVSPLALKAFGAMVLALLIAAMWYRALLHEGRPPLLGLCLLGLNPLILIWGATLRGYGLACVFIVLTFTTLAPGPWWNRRGWAFWGLVCAIGSVQCVLQNSCLLFGIGIASALVFAVQRGWKKAALVLGIGLLSALSIAPYLPRYLHADWRQLVQQSQGTIGEQLQLQFDGFQFVLMQPYPWVFGVWVAILGLGMIAAVSPWIVRSASQAEPPVPLRTYGLLTLLIACGAFFLFLFCLNYRPRPWYYLPLLAVLACCADALFVRLAHKDWFRVMRLLVVLALLVLIPWGTFERLKYRLTNLDLAARILEERADPDDLILVSPWYFAVSFNWHYHGAARWVTLPILGKLDFHRYDLVRARMISSHPLDDLEEELETTLKSGHRVWVVGSLMPIPADGPKHYAPAPDPQVGWNEEAYTVSWIEQITAFMKTHIQSVGVVEFPDEGPVGNAEDISLIHCSGWRN